MTFPSVLPHSPLGSWTLFEPDTLVYAAHCKSPFADGEVYFAENRTEPPSRAYLKLWEVFTLLGRWPQPGERTIDLGSSPGGWTWVLDQLGARVVSIDKAPLVAELKLSSRVDFRTESAFAVDPQSIGPVDWLFSDVICYPERLLQLVHAWKDIARHMVCTIKFQGATDHTILDQFLAVPGSQVMHLFHNKHELTWVRMAETTAPVALREGQD